MLKFVRTFLSRFDEEKKIKYRKVAGLALAAFALFTLIASTSYLFTWKADYSLLPEADGGEVSNLGGSMGYRWGRFLVARCFGLGAYALIAWLFAASVRMFFRKKTIGMWRASIIMLSCALLSSFILSYISSLFGGDTFFGGGLGGDCGHLAMSWSSSVFGVPATGIFLAVFVIAWLLYANGSFARWFIRAGESEKKKTADKPKEKPVEEEQVSVDEVIEEPPFDILDPFGQNDDEPDDIETGVRPAVPPVWKTEGESIEVRGASGVVTAHEPVDTGIEVVEGEELSTDVKKEPSENRRALRYGQVRISFSGPAG